MSAHAYTEEQLVEQPAKAKPPSPWPSPSGRGNDGLFAELGWAVAGPPPNAGIAGEPRDAGLLGRETKGEVVTRDRSAMSLRSGQVELASTEQITQNAKSKR